MRISVSNFIQDFKKLVALISCIYNLFCELVTLFNLDC